MKADPHDPRVTAPAWSAPGKYVWDSWFARHQGTLHVFYLQADVEACGGDPERRHDLASIGHATASSRGWDEVEPALGAAGESAWDDLALWTGSVVPASPFAPFALFYTARRRADPLVATPHELQRVQQIGLAFSDDLTRWKRSPRSRRGPVIPNPGTAAGFDGVAWRDPYVVRDPQDRFHAFICARVAGASPDAGGAVAHVTGVHPEEWGAARVFVASAHFYQMEVPQFFWRLEGEGKRGYLLFSAQEKDCSAQRRAEMPPEECHTGTYWMSSEAMPRDFTGLPPLREPARLLAPGLYAGKLVDPETEAPLLFGFPWPAKGESFTGGISAPRAVRFRAAGGPEVRAAEATPWPG